MNCGDGVLLGPIRPEHVGDDWRLEGDERGGWWLSRPVGDLSVKIYATTPTTCAWSIYRADGWMLREASSRNVDEAKTAAVAWIRDRL